MCVEEKTRKKKESTFGMQHQLIIINSYLKNKKNIKKMDEKTL